MIDVRGPRPLWAVQPWASSPEWRLIESRFIEWLLMTFCWTHEDCLDQPSSEKLPPAAEVNKYRDPQLDTMQRVRDPGILSPKCDVFIKFLPSELWEPCRWGGRKRKRTRRDGGHQLNKVL